MDKDKRIIVFGAKGLVGSAIVRDLRCKGYKNILTPSKETVNLLSKPDTCEYIQDAEPEWVFLAAAKVGGIQANKTYPADFGYQNGQINLNVIDCCHKTKVKKLLYLGSSCIYPNTFETPIKEEDLLSSKLEKTNELYALAKIFGLKLCEAYRQQYGDNFISCMPCNLYGPNDNFDLNSSHVLPAMIRKIHEAKINGTKAILWGTGTPLREFLYVDDLADACEFLMCNYNEGQHINVGYGKDISIADLAKTICEVIGFNERDIEWDTSKPDGTKRKIMDSSKINSLGWTPKTHLIDGIRKTYDFFKK